MHNPLDHAARVLAETDPVRRFHAAEAAAEAAAAPYKQAADDALAELIAQHGGNRAAAARELGKTRQALYMREKRDAEKSSSVAAAEQVQPARRFDSPEEAEDALRDWALSHQEVTDRLDVLLLGALAAGVDPVAISEAGVVGLDMLRRIRPAGNIVVSQLDEYGPEIDDFARAVHARATALRAAAISTAKRAAADIWRHAAREIARNAAPVALMPDHGLRKEDFGTIDEFIEAVVTRKPSKEEEAEDAKPLAPSASAGPDAYLAATYLAFRREATRGPLGSERTPEEVAVGEAVQAAFGELADAILHLRTTGQVPPALLTEAS
ncbi:hypothetical protein ACIQ9R_36245 [Streptomyces sp. NPDC094447]|uniref:hypothetical protein n=1 Tax=Streptomyces sp. NPDC094447 TaxID=3366062 RepID=UPI0037F2A79A